jgi:hypothetical protein
LVLRFPWKQGQGQAGSARGKSEVQGAIGIIARCRRKIISEALLGDIKNIAKSQSVSMREAKLVEAG